MWQLTRGEVSSQSNWCYQGGLGIYEPHKNAERGACQHLHKGTDLCLVLSYSHLMIQEESACSCCSRAGASDAAAHLQGSVAKDLFELDVSHRVPFQHLCDDNVQHLRLLA